jgi:3-(3-hydroxy-phenyl)propionate hydroxylase
MIDLALRMGRVMMPTSPLQGALVRGAFHLLGIMPAARDYFAQMKYKPKPRFRSGLIVDDAQPSRTTIVGSLIPQPIIETSDGHTSLMDDLLPDQPVVLIYAEKPEDKLSAQDNQTLADIGVATFGLTPEWTKAQSSHIPAGRDVNRLLATPTYRRYLDHFILLRRDRYIATATPCENLDELVSSIKSSNLC